MVGLTSLSQELLDLIIGNIRDRPTLVVLCCVSKLLNHLATPRLYSNIVLNQSQRDLGTLWLRQLTYMLLKSATLAANVRKLTISESYWVAHSFTPRANLPQGSWPDHADVFELLRIAIEQKLARAPSVPDDLFMAMCQFENEDELVRSKEGLEDDVNSYTDIIQADYNEAAILALLLPKLPNLKSLDLKFDVEYDGTGKDDPKYSHFISKMFAHALVEKDLGLAGPTFSRLTRVMVSGADDKYPSDPRFLAACAGLPSMKSLYGWNQGEENDPTNPCFKYLRPHSTSLEYLELRHSKLSLLNFDYLIRSPKSLKTFIYEIGNTWAVSHPDEASHVWDLANKLQWAEMNSNRLQLGTDSQKQSLQKICLSHAPFYPFSEDEEINPMIFREYPALKSLRIAPVYLYGAERLQLVCGEATRSRSAPEVTMSDLQESRMILVEALPKQIEVLELVYCNDGPTLDRLTISLDELLDRKTQDYPYLRLVSVHSLKHDASTMQRRLSFEGFPWQEKNVRLLVKKEVEPDYKRKNYIQRQWGWDYDVTWSDCHGNECGPTETIYDSQASTMLERLLDSV